MKKAVNNMILISQILIFFLILVCSIFMQSNIFYEQNKLISLLFALILIVIFYELIKINKKIENISNKKTLIFIIIYFLLVSILQVIVLKCLSVEPNWDFGVVFNNAIKYVETGSRLGAGYIEYFQYFPNNIMLFILMVIFIKIGNIFGISALFSCYIMNILFIDLALLLLFLTLRKKYNNLIGIIGLIITFFFIPLFLYTPIFYSDTISLFIPILLLLLYLNVDELNDRKNNIIFSLIGIILFIGFQLKVNSIFILIAILIDYILKNKKIILNITIMLLVFILLTISFKHTIINNDNFQFKQNEYGGYPFTHWIMMGVEDIDKDNSGRNAYGGYSEEDFNLSRGFNTGKEAIEFNISEYLSRVNKMGLIGYGAFLTKKSVNVWTDGYYFADTKLSLKPLNSDNVIRKIMLENETSKQLLINFTQGVQYAFIIIMILGSIIKLKNKDKNIDYLRLTVLGLFLFFLFWEARSRYIFNYIPIFIVIMIETGMLFLERKNGKDVKAD